LYSGPYQNETSSDAIGDKPYVIDANNIDHYPLMNKVIPELQPLILLPLFIISTLLAATVHRKRHAHTTSKRQLSILQKTKIVQLPLRYKTK
jgi:hypothetical protein